MKQFLIKINMEKKSDSKKNSYFTIPYLRQSEEEVNTLQCGATSLVLSGRVKNSLYIHTDNEG